MYIYLIVSDYLTWISPFLWLLNSETYWQCTLMAGLMVYDKYIYKVELICLPITVITIIIITIIIILIDINWLRFAGKLIILICKHSNVRINCHLNGKCWLTLPNIHFFSCNICGVLEILIQNNRNLVNMKRFYVKFIYVKFLTSHSNFEGGSILYKSSYGLKFFRIARYLSNCDKIDTTQTQTPNNNSI